MQGMVARQFGHPHGLFGRLIGRGMARSNADFSRWTVSQVRKHADGTVARIVELGPGPGIGLEELLRAFPEAKVWGVDPSREMLAQSRRRNAAATHDGRLSLVQGGVDSVTDLAPVDVAAANHVLYFWPEPESELSLIGRSVRPGGVLALGYQLRQNMPPMAQKHFPRHGFRLYDSDDEVSSLLRSAGFAQVTQSFKGSPERPEGRLALAYSRDGAEPVHRPPSSS